jgi:biotin---protein ligase
MNWLRFYGTIILRRFSRQKSGRGRGGNGWISPRGSMAVTTVLKFDPIPPFLVFVQYVAGLAVVEAVRSVPGFEDLPLHVKWPNDVYYVDPDAERRGTMTPEQAIKLGGVLVTCQSMGSAVDVMVGVGVNVANPHPTVSLAQVTARWAALQGKRLEPLSVEYVLARFLTKFEEFVEALSIG